VADLLARAFGVLPTTPFLSPEVMRWKYWDTRQDWAEPRSFLLERGDRLIAHAGVWPAHLVVGGENCRGAQMIDWAADSSTPGAGLAMLQRIARMFDFVYAIGGSPSARAVVPSAGFREIGRSWRAARPIRPWRMALGAPRQRATPARLLRNLAWSTFPMRIGVGRWHYERAAVDELPGIADLAGYIPRTPEFFLYLSRCPASQCVAYRVLDRGRPRGAFLLTLVRHQARLAAWLDDPTPPLMQIVYVLAQRAAREHRGVYELSTTGTTESSASASTAAGLRIRRTAPVHLLSRRGLWTEASPGIEFQVTDSDAVFLDDGGVQFLC
jgi:hypothetical protein